MLCCVVLCCVLVLNNETIYSVVLYKCVVALCCIGLGCAVLRFVFLYNVTLYYVVFSCVAFYCVAVPCHTWNRGLSLSIGISFNMRMLIALLYCITLHYIELWNINQPPFWSSLRNVYFFQRKLLYPLNSSVTWLEKLWKAFIGYRNFTVAHLNIVPNRAVIY